VAAGGIFRSFGPRTPLGLIPFFIGRGELLDAKDLEGTYSGDHRHSRGRRLLLASLGGRAVLEANNRRSFSFILIKLLH